MFMVRFWDRELVMLIMSPNSGIDLFLFENYNTGGRVCKQSGLINPSLPGNELFRLLHVPTMIDFTKPVRMTAGIDNLDTVLYILLRLFN